MIKLADLEPGEYFVIRRIKKDSRKYVILYKHGFFFTPLTYTVKISNLTYKKLEKYKNKAIVIKVHGKIDNKYHYTLEESVWRGRRRNELEKFTEEVDAIPTYEEAIKDPPPTYEECFK